VATGGGKRRRPRGFLLPRSKRRASKRGKSVDREGGEGEARERVARARSLARDEPTNQPTNQRTNEPRVRSYTSHAAAVRCESRIASFLLPGPAALVVPLALRFAPPLLVPSVPPAPPLGPLPSPLRSRSPPPPSLPPRPFRSPLPAPRAPARSLLSVVRSMVRPRPRTRARSFQLSVPGRHSCLGFRVFFLKDRLLSFILDFS
jgi:hypothetical protein